MILPWRIAFYKKKFKIKTFLQKGNSNIFTFHSLKCIQLNVNEEFHN